MTKAEAIAYVQAQTVCALAAIEAMKAENAHREACGMSVAYGEEAFLQIPVTYGIHHNAVVSLFQEAAE